MFTYDGATGWDSDWTDAAPPPSGRESKLPAGRESSVYWLNTLLTESDRVVADIFKLALHDRHQPTGGLVFLSYSPLFILDFLRFATFTSVGALSEMFAFQPLAWSGLLRAYMKVWTKLVVGQQADFGNCEAYTTSGPCSLSPLGSLVHKNEQTMSLPKNQQLLH